MGAGRIQRASAVLLFTAVAAWEGACSAITGASGYTDITGCTGPECSIACAAQGGTWDPSRTTCTCAGGVAPCNGICCGTTAPHCVRGSGGIPRCSTCSLAAFECGPVCCENQSCLSASIGACGAPYGVLGQSCAGGLDCPIRLRGGTTENADCCESILLPGGAFEMGRSLSGKNQCPDPYCDVDEEPEHAVTLSPYRLDRFEVTVSRFRKFVDAWDYRAPPDGAGGDPIVAGAGWQSAWSSSLPASRGDLERDLACRNAPREAPTWTTTPGYDENVPVNCVTWYEAFAFCAWDGGRLPTEAEWESAAANGADADLYPWGEAHPAEALTVYACNFDPVPCAGPYPPIPAYVGSRPDGANRSGHSDLAGNVAEWVLDAVASYTSAHVTNPANTTNGFRVTRGGGFLDRPDSLRAAARSSQPPAVPSPAIGIRCARSP